ncbi:11728_t:CDS:2 [Diversispora eburnea]|uniref:11728_t:CDS:1 n=1 Tax=Diversispora eburnea TaxID=1213867 RepID=A0A9N8ZQP3_9GLOM|nr:11728_t:CDS:2 [Diversispora eburnea]
MHTFNAVSHIGRKRTRSNSMNKCEQTQKTPRLLSPQHQRSFPPSLSICNERRYSRSNSIGDLSCRTQLLAVQDSRYSEPMDCDIPPCEFENFDYDMNSKIFIILQFLEPIS